MMRVVIVCVVLAGIGAVSFGFFRSQKGQSIVSPVLESFSRPLDAYTIPQLSRTPFASSSIELVDPVSVTDSFRVQSFRMAVADAYTGAINHARIVSGRMHIPVSPAPEHGYPVIVQFRGYVDTTQYRPGLGTERSAQVFAKNGFVSIAPDFLGYGTSSTPSADIFEERFQTYTTALTLLASVHTLPFADASRVGIWGHSNGGQIALTVAEITGKPYPLSLWAPVTKPFPYSILYYTDEANDRGKYLRKKLAEFERMYDADLYSLTNYLELLRGHIHIQQGGQDDAVPIAWTDEFVPILRDAGVDVEYQRYPQSDHNLMPDWNTVIARDIEFFRRHLTVTGR